jgi:hypothetical protein
MDDKIKYLLSLAAVRDRAKVVGEAAEAGKLSHFDVHEERLDEVADFVTSVIKVCLYFLLSPLNVFPIADSTAVSATTVQTNTTPSLHTVAGSISRLATCRG